MVIPLHNALLIMQMRANLITLNFININETPFSYLHLPVYKAVHNTHIDQLIIF